MQASGLSLSVQNMPKEAPGFLQDSTQGPRPVWALPVPTRDDSSPGPGHGHAGMPRVEAPAGKNRLENFSPFCILMSDFGRG